MIRNFKSKNTLPAGGYRQRGYTAPELAFGVVVVTVLLVLLLPRLDGFLGQTSQNVGTVEATKVVAGLRQYKQLTGSYASVNMTNLSSGGYGLDEYTDGVGQNAYNLNVTVAPVTGNATATITYQTDSTAACSQLIARITGVDGVASASCSTNDATITVS